MLCAAAVNMGSSFRRLAKDHTSLLQSLPPNYLFPVADDSVPLPDDLTQLLVLVTGAVGTPYSQGLWRLHLKMPADYPKSPPKATFKTRIYHPNVEEHTGAVCLETLKRDWDPKLTLKDILITISCLLIQPNPDSALNAAAGALIQEDYDAFSRQARLMTSIHAPIPKQLREAVQEAQRRGEDIESKASGSTAQGLRNAHSKEPATAEPLGQALAQENDSSQSPIPISTPQLNPRKNTLGKRPMMELPALADPLGNPPLDDNSQPISSSELNIANVERIASREDSVQQPVRKSPKLMRLAHDHPKGAQSEIVIHEDTDSATATGLTSEEEKENISSSDNNRGSSEKSAVLPSMQSAPRPSLRKVSNLGSARGKGPRVGIRRL